MTSPKRNAWGRPLCRGRDCEIEIRPGERVCPVHGWILAAWLDRSRTLLQRLKKGVDADGIGG